MVNMQFMRIPIPYKDAVRLTSNDPRLPVIRVDGNDVWLWGAMGKEIHLTILGINTGFEWWDSSNDPFGMVVCANEN
jgi:hypothetical protein